MKKCVYFTAILLLATIPAMAVQIDNFDSYDLGNVADVASPPWVVTTPADSTEVPVIHADDDGNQYLESICTYINVDGIANGQTGTVFCRVMIPGGRDPDCSFGMSDITAATGAWDDYESYCSVVGTELRVREGSSNTAVATLEEDTWYNIWIVTNNASDTHDVYLTTGSDEPTDADRVAQGFAYRNGTTDTLGTFKIYGRGSSSSARAIYFDDIYILSGVNLTLDMLKYRLTQSSGPSPYIGETDVALDATLTWKAGKDAKAHDVYFGTNFNDVNDASRTAPGDVLVSMGQSDTSYSPGELALDGVYFWRVDEVLSTDNSITPGKVWSFTAEPTLFKTVPVNVTASSVRDADPNNTINESGLDENDLHSTDEPAMWLTADNEAIGAWIQYEFATPQKLDTLLVWNANPPYETFLGVGIKEALIETSLDGETWSDLTDTVIFNRATGLPNYSANTTIDCDGVVAQYVKITCLSHYSTSPMVSHTGLSEVRFLTIPMASRRPDPESGTMADGLLDSLIWRAGRGAQQHDLYLDIDETLVVEGDSSAWAGSLTECSFDLLEAGVLYDETYFWKVVETAGDEVTDGEVWSFTMPECLVIDDMESYTSIEGARIFDVWMDGYEEDNNGSIVGYDVADGPFTEDEITFDGSGQSMPFEYNNTKGLTSAWASLDLGGQNWSLGGLKTLVLYYKGQESNSEATFYIKIDGQRIESSKSLRTPVWQQMAIELDTLKIDLTGVNEFVIGVDGTGSGLLLIDEIKILRDVYQVESPVNPASDGLVVHYSMEGTLTNQAGSQYSGVGNVTLFYSNSSFSSSAGKSVILDGIDNDISIPDLGGLISNLTSSSYSAWVSIDDDAEGNWMRVFDFGTGTENYMFLCPRTGTSGSPRAAILTQAMTDDGTGEARTPSGQALSSGWHHLAVVFEEGDPNGLMTLYVDGWSAGTVETPDMPKDLGNTTQNWLGKSQWDADDLFQGQMDEFRIYNRALSEGEIRYLAGDR